MDVDFSELDRLVADLADAPTALPKHLRKAVNGAALGVKKDAVRKVSQRKFFKGGASAIDYDLTGFSGAVSGMDAEIGYNKGKASGKLGNLIEFGAPNAPRMMQVRSKGKWVTVPVPGGGKRPLPPGGELQKALAANREDFERGILNAVDDALREVSL